MSEGTMAATILVVDDEQDVRTYLRTLFAKAGYTVETAEDGEEGLTQAKAARPDLIFLDIMMPKRTGIMLYRRLKKDDDLKGIPVIAVTAFAMKGDEDRVREGGCEAYIAKPIRIDELMGTVRHFLGE